MIEEILPQKELQLSKDLMDLEAYISELSNFLPLAIATVNPVGVIVNINKAFETLTGFQPIEIVGEYFNTLFLEKAKIRAFEEEVQKREKAGGKNLTLVTREKKRIPVDLSATARRDEKGDFIGYFVSFTDISAIQSLEQQLEEKIRGRTQELEERTKELKKSQTALMNILEDAEEAKKRAEEEKNKTESIIFNLVDGLLVFDKLNRLSLINPQAEEFLGVKFDEIRQKPMFELGQFPNFKQLVSVFTREDRDFFRKEIEIKENLILEVSAVQLTREKEKIGTLTILHDITREKIIERMKTEFVSVSAHQLRTPLSAIKWTLRMLLDEDLGPITREQRNFIEKTYQSNERMISLINDLLNVSRMEEGRYLFKPILTDMASVIQFVVNSYRDEFAKKGVKFEVITPERKLPQLLIDAEKMKLAVQNLVDNSLHYTEKGGKVTIALDGSKGGIQFSIKDTGVGIPKDQWDRIFTKFFRGANVVRLSTEGTGLGLFITKNIIEAHKGKIWFESGNGEGTTFYFTIPVKKETPFEKLMKEF